MAPHLSEARRAEALSEALVAARAIGDEYPRAKALGGLAPHLSQPLQPATIEEWMELLPSLKRTEALETLMAFLPVLSPFLGETGLRLVARTLIDVGKWWP